MESTAENMKKSIPCEIIKFGKFNTQYGCENFTPQNCRQMIKNTKCNDVRISIDFESELRSGWTPVGCLKKLKLTKYGVVGLIQFTPRGINAIKNGQAYACDGGVAKRCGTNVCLKSLNSIGLSAHPNLPLRKIRLA